MMKFIKKQLLTMSIALAVVFPYITPADKPNIPVASEICTMSNCDTSPFDDTSDIPIVP